ncbi:MAG: PAS sensor domain-containing protein [Sulfurimonas sp.]|nr:MAG: PAS sensor domain-containing protein [Sulfurimonas sp.]
MKEYILKSDDFLVSQTDEKGIIIFANNDFCKISGYSIEELVGEHHNLVRHNDMPKAAFKDLWSTVKKDKIWSGYVKNSTKNGDFYWVYATVFPKYDPISRKKSYISCRRKASTKEINEAQNIYKTLV